MKSTLSCVSDTMLFGMFSGMFGENEKEDDNPKQVSEKPEEPEKHEEEEQKEKAGDEQKEKQEKRQPSPPVRELPKQNVSNFKGKFLDQP